MSIKYIIKSPGKNLSHRLTCMKQITQGAHKLTVVNADQLQHNIKNSKSLSSSTVEKTNIITYLRIIITTTVKPLLIHA